eukprot:TRINITY_DN32566_c0_g1_i7.p1 TRINITY_DN32566_c0_g1~~TRINITY_DN32566_c0_g1_i7.p1  ORF type:complete len:310 (+),score=59.47 TRINITY_DN32566_c0_g1_i7:271-1200(+)
MVSRRDNLTLFNVPRLSSRETYDDCVTAVMEVLKGTVSGKVWCHDDIVQAHRLGRFNDNHGRPPPMIVKFARWCDTMAVLTHGKAALRRRDVTVAGDLTEKQRETVQQYRSQGLHAYYRGDRLVVEEQKWPQQYRFQRGQRDREGRGHRQDARDDYYYYHASGYYNRGDRYDAGNWEYDNGRRGNSARGEPHQGQWIPDSRFDERPAADYNRRYGGEDCSYDGRGMQDWNYFVPPYPYYASMQHFPLLPPTRNVNNISGQSNNVDATRTDNTDDITDKNMTERQDPTGKVTETDTDTQERSQRLPCTLR